MASGSHTTTFLSTPATGPLRSILKHCPVVKSTLAPFLSRPAQIMTTSLSQRPKGDNKSFPASASCCPIKVFSLDLKHCLLLSPLIRFPDLPEEVGNPRCGCCNSTAVNITGALPAPWNLESPQEKMRHSWAACQALFSTTRVYTENKWLLSHHGPSWLLPAHPRTPGHQEAASDTSIERRWLHKSCGLPYLHLLSCKPVP